VESLNFHHLRYFLVVAREGSVSRAAEQLRVTQPTISGQLRELAEQLGQPLFKRVGRNLELTELGQSVARMAEEIFTLGDRLVQTARGIHVGRPLRLSVGVSDAVPKHVAYRMLEPALAARVQVVCHEDTPAKLQAELAVQGLDVVISDAPSHQAGMHDHLLGECGVSVWGVRRLAKEMRVGFPRSLDGAPFVVPTSSTGFRRELDAWFLSHKIKPRIVGELEDAALLDVFGEMGVGLFAAPDVIADAGRPRALMRVGPIKGLRARYYAITTERQLPHPAVALVSGAEKLFGTQRER
jgi:LysR family transcriptional regulator, transcriptional activator of nhaA